MGSIGIGLSDMALSMASPSPGPAEQSAAHAHVRERTRCDLCGRVVVDIDDHLCVDHEVQLFLVGRSA